ncbi:MAG: glutathione synthase [Proteobacteria bacterium]|nr:glutathione synthase [Pseudomonadota bacterium]
MIKLLVIMDPVEKIILKKDSTIALLKAAQKRRWEIYYIQPKDLMIYQQKVQALCRKMTINDDPENWHTFQTPPQLISLAAFDIIFMRKDPPVDNHYLYATYLLEMAQHEGCFVVNDPRSMRDANEKLFATWFPQCCPELLVSANHELLLSFLHKQKKIVVKPLHGMAGQSVFLLTDKDPNVNVTLELLTQQETIQIMAQRYIPQISQGDKRILMIDGKPYPYALARIPAPDDFRGNLAKRAKGIGCELSPRDLYLCEQVGETLKKKGLFFVGLDVIGDYITEINVTSPTGICEIEAAFNINITEEILDRLVEYITPR